MHASIKNSKTTHHNIIHHTITHITSTSGAIQHYNSQQQQTPTEQLCNKTRTMIRNPAFILAVLVQFIRGAAFVSTSAPKQARIIDGRPSFVVWSTSSDEEESNEALLLTDNEESSTYYSPNVPLDGQELLEGDGVRRVNLDSSLNEYAFFDEAFIYVRAGSGGQGASTYKKGTGGQDGIADGGNGGNGGNIIFIVDESLNTLAGLTNAWRPNAFGGSGAAANAVQDQRQSFRAENGADGGRQVKNGRYGKDVTIRVPPGTVIQEQGEEWEGDEQLLDLGSLSLEEPTLMVAIGGTGGEGSGIGGRGRGVKRARIPPQGGERKTLKLTLKIVADVAIVGVPNSGKSTFLASVTRAKPKIANVRISLFELYNIVTLSGAHTYSQIAIRQLKTCSIHLQLSFPI
jgi:hypothetical protein